MAIDAVGEGLEFLGHFVGFWAFLLNPRFRASTLERWRGRSKLEHFFTAFDVVVSTFCGLIPIIVLYWIVFR